MRTKIFHKSGDVQEQMSEIFDYFHYHDARKKDFLVPVEKLEKDVLLKLDEPGSVNKEQAMYLVRLFYSVQDHRIRVMNQSRALINSYIDDFDIEDITEIKVSNQLYRYFVEQFKTLENQMAMVLDRFVDSHPMGPWLRSIYGIGPILAAGVLAHIDISKVEHVTQIWSFAGLNPKQKWEKGQRRPWNAELRTLCWKIGQSFCKFHRRPECFYGAIYAERKKYEVERNDKGGNRKVIDEELAICKIDKDSDYGKILKSGKLPPGRIDARARRYAVKMFLSHLFELWYTQYHGRAPQAFYAFAVLKHDQNSYVPPPNKELISLVA